MAGVHGPLRDAARRIDTGCGVRPVGTQQAVVLVQVHRGDLHQRRSRRRRRLTEAGLDRQHADQLAPAQKFLQRLGHGLFALAAGQVQEVDVLLVGTPRLLDPQRVVGPPERRRRVEVLAVDVAGERPGLAHQPADHVPVVDVVLVLAAQPLQPQHHLLRVPHLDLVHADPRLDFLADQPRRHRVGVVLDADGAQAADPDAQPLQRLQPRRRQPPHARQLGDRPRRPADVAGRHQFAQPLLVGSPAGEVPAAPQAQRLVHGLLEVPVRRLGVPVLVAARRVGRLRRHAVMRHERLVVGRELLRVAVVVDGQRHPVRSVPPRHGPQRPHRVLPAGAQAGETLGEAHRHVLPVGVRQHKVIDQVLEGHALQGHLQVVHPGKVRGGQAARGVLLGEEHLLVRAVLRLPLADAPLQRAPHRGGILAGVRLLQPVPERLGHQARLGLQQGQQFGPDLGQGIATGPPRMRPPRLAGERASGPVLACRFTIHVGLQRCLPQRCSFL